MTEEELYQILLDAYYKGVEVRLAKKPTDVEIPGIHLIEPSIEDVLEGIANALKHGCDTVMLHTKLTWPYRS